jgi:prostamide/prostaglandin F2alpha synthase
MQVTGFGKMAVKNARQNSEITRLESFWNDSPCALFFLRRLGCSICRSYIRLVEEIREEYEKKGVKMIALSFEAFGEGSDSDHSFEKGGFWKGPVYVIDKAVYEALFGRKGMFDSFFGLLDINKEAYQRSKDTPGNLKGDGFQLGGQFVIGQGGLVRLDHRQKAFGDDVPILKLMMAIESCTQ